VAGLRLCRKRQRKTAIKNIVDMLLLSLRNHLEKEVHMRQYKIIVEKHPDGYVAYPLGIKGVVVGEGDTYEEALSDVKSAIRFHIETFGPDVL
jgi:predicted RNase H-like HicB family nuclease